MISQILWEVHETLCVFYREIGEQTKSIIVAIVLLNLYFCCRKKHFPSFGKFSLLASFAVYVLIDLHSFSVERILALASQREQAHSEHMRCRLSLGLSSTNFHDNILRSPRHINNSLKSEPLHLFSLAEVVFNGNRKFKCSYTVYVGDPAFTKAKKLRIMFS